MNKLQNFIARWLGSKDHKAVLNSYFEIGVPKVDYLMNISKQYKFMYIETPKVACSSVKKTLQKIELKDTQIALPERVHIKSTSPLLSPDDLTKKELKAVLQSEEYFRFSFVRNPYSRIVSAYLEKIATDVVRARNFYRPLLNYHPDDSISFIDFLKAISKQSPAQKDIHWTPQTQLLAYPKINYHFVGRFENFAADLEFVVNKILPSGQSENKAFITTARRHSVQADSRMQEFLDAEAIELICQIYEDDFQNFGYSFDPEI